MESTSKFWHFTSYKNSHTDLQYSTVLFAMQTVFLFLVAVAIKTPSVWFFLIMPPILDTFMKCVYYTNINFCYPVQVRAMFMAISYGPTLCILWTQEYIVEAVQARNNFDVYFYSQLGVAVLALLLTPVIFMRIMRIDSHWLRRLDQPRLGCSKLKN